MRHDQAVLATFPRTEDPFIIDPRGNPAVKDDNNKPEALLSQPMNDRLSGVYSLSLREVIVGILGNSSRLLSHRTLC